MSTNRLKWYLTLSAAGLSGAAAAVAYITRRALHEALPDLQGSHHLKGLHRPVEILRDRWGVPHIYAHNEEDLFFAQGYAQAQDRLFQMDAQRRTGYGRLSELAGAIAIDTDRMARIFGWHHAAEAQWRGMQQDPQARAVAEAFAAGVNAFIAQGPLPAEYRLLRSEPQPWQPRDGAAWGAVLAWGLSVNWQTELLRLRLIEELGHEKAADLAPACPPDYQTIFPGAQIGARFSQQLLQAFGNAAADLPLGQIAMGLDLGSNNWAVSGRWTRSGRPMLANDPHLPPIFPALWYENHLVGGRYDVAGFTTPGVPAVILGHNRHIAWGLTNAYADIQDLFVERFHEYDRLLYASESGWLRAVEHEELIHVRGRSEPIVERVRHTRHGPVISDLLAAETPPDAAQEDLPLSGNTNALSLRWACHDENNHLRAVLDICKAATWDEFNDAARHWAFPPQNLVYADTAGNVGYLMPGRVPQRRKGHGLLPVPAWTGEYAWQGWLAHEALPALFNPQTGYVVTANNHVAGDDYPHLLSGEWLAPYRARRIATLIAELAPLDITAHARIQTDTVSLPAQRFVQLALAALDAVTVRAMSAAAQRALSQLQSWDGDMRPAALQSALAFGWQVCFTRAAITQALGPRLAHELLDEGGLEGIPLHPFHSIAQELALRWLQDGPPPWVGQVEPLLPAALQETLDILRAKFGDRETNWQWGRIHYVELHSHLARIPGVGRLWKPLTYPLGGDSYSVNQARVAPRFPPGTANVIASCRMILDVGAWDNSVSTLPGGQSAHPASEHYQDSVEDWLQGKYHPMPYSRARVETAAHNHLVLRPDPGEGSYS